VPGGRLTHEERRQIAGWLADGLGYAEIARRLGRPTSTISREVGRNSVSGVYLADRAQHTAGHRARRRKPARVAEPASGDERLREFVAEFATALATTGLPSMTARVFVCLLTADATGLTSAEIVAGLRVSPASVSKSIGFLAGMDLVVRQQDSGGRRERYLVGDDVWLRAWQTDTGAHGAVASIAQRGVEIVGADSAAGVRLARMGRFFARLSEHMGGSSLAESIVDDARTVLAALTHVRRPLTRDALATALGWPGDRVTTALDALARHPRIADPFTVRAENGAYEVVISPDRLSREQRAALER
jgi:hypothetical protein